jgi:hypothetical protein
VRPKADQAVSSVSAALALVDNIGSLLLRNTEQMSNLGFGLFLRARVSAVIWQGGTSCVRRLPNAYKYAPEEMVLVLFLRPQGLASLIVSRENDLAMPT